MVATCRNQNLPQPKCAAACRNLNLVAPWQNLDQRSSKWRPMAPSGAWWRPVSPSGAVGPCRPVPTPPPGGQRGSPAQNQSIYFFFGGDQSVNQGGVAARLSRDMLPTHLNTAMEAAVLGGGQIEPQSRRSIPPLRGKTNLSGNFKRMEM
jgi:hypothetical protein